MFLIASDMPDEGVRCLDTFRDSRAHLYRQLDLANVTVHVYDPLGLETQALDAGALPGSCASARRSYGLDRWASLATLPKHTGGRLLVDVSQPEQQVEAALDERRLHYLGAASGGPGVVPIIQVTERMMAIELSPRLSLVIPAFNERECLPRLLDSVDEARSQYRHGPDRVQVIVADNASTDGTGLVAADRGCLVARVERRAIAAARNGGAQLACGEVLAFVDADMRIDPQTFDAIDTALQSPRVVGGATGVRLERWSLGVAVTYALLLPGIWATGLDTGVVFCRRRDFEAIGGYREEMLCAEDVQFLLALRRRGKAAGQRLIRLRRVKALASMRKFDQFGEWHYFRMFAHAARCGLRGRAMSGFARRYWYDVRGG